MPPFSRHGKIAYELPPMYTVFRYNQQHVILKILMDRPSASPVDTTSTKFEYIHIRVLLSPVLNTLENSEGFLRSTTLFVGDEGGLHCSVSGISLYKPSIPKYM